MPYTCFTRNWYRYERTSSGEKKIVPDPGARRTRHREFNTEQEAREYCENYNSTHKPGPLSRKMEYTSRY